MQYNLTTFERWDNFGVSKKAGTDKLLEQGLEMEIRSEAALDATL